MSEAVLVLNAGSSSIKFSLFAGDGPPSRQQLLCEGACDGIGHATHFTAKDGRGAKLLDQQMPQGVSHADALAAILDWIGPHFPDHRLVAAGHRVVHGGSLYTGPVRIDAQVVAELTRLIPLAPLHQPHPLHAIAALSKLDANLPQVACFDTSFHCAQPGIATALALPRRFAEEGVQRYGFHGLSYEYIASVLPAVLGATEADGRIVVAHLGNGASMCAMRGRKSLATTMGFTALDGLPMSRRCGSLDPGVILYMLEQKGMTAAEVSDVLYHQSGLFGVSGISDDMRTLLASADRHAAEAVDLFVYHIGRQLGSLAAAIGGLDALVFTAGIGEHAAEIRRRVCVDAAWLGIDLDEAANAAGGPRLSRAKSRTSAWVIPTDEDLMIARHTYELLQAERA
jgi:acetate kinase